MAYLVYIRVVGKLLQYRNTPIYISTFLPPTHINRKVSSYDLMSIYSIFKRSFSSLNIPDRRSCYFVFLRHDFGSLCIRGMSSDKDMLHILFFIQDTYVT